MAATARPEVPIPQRLVIVAPSSARFDSRTFRIATTAVARGHEVTVMARQEPGLPVEEHRPEGYRVIRVPTSAIDGLPLPARIRRWLAARRRRPTRRVGGGEVGDGQGGSSGPDRPAPDEDAPAASSRQAGRVRRAWSGAVRIGAIALTVRSQARATLARAPAADLYHGMAYMGVPIALRLGRQHRARVVYDARDIYVDAGNLSRLPGPARRLVGWVERRWARRVDRVITVNEEYAEVMRSRWGTPKPLVVMNCSYRFDPPEPKERLFHDRLGLASDRRVVLYHGGLSRDRGIEQLIVAIDDVPGADLVVMGYGALWSELERRAVEAGKDGRLHLLPPVDPADLLRWVAAADVVAVPIQASTLNHRLTTPNKLLEALAAGVPVVASDLPGIAGVVRAAGAGPLVDASDPTALAAALRDLLDEPPDDRDARRRQILVTAHATYNWEAQAEKLLAEYSRITGARW